MLSSTPAERLPAMCGKATLATLVSSTSIKVASITVMAITQGLVSPFCRARANKVLIVYVFGWIPGVRGVQKLG